MNSESCILLLPPQTKQPAASYTGEWRRKPQAPSMEIHGLSLSSARRSRRRRTTRLSIPLSLRGASLNPGEPARGIPSDDVDPLHPFQLKGEQERGANGAARSGVKTIVN